MQKRTEIGQAADRNRRHQKEGATAHMTAEKQFEDGLTPWGFSIVLNVSVCQIRAAEDPKAIYGGRISPFHSWSFERMTLKPHTSYTVRQIKRPFFLASIPTKDRCFVCAIGSRRDFPARLSISHVNIVSPIKANESRNCRYYPNGNSYLAFQTASK